MQPIDKSQIIDTETDELLGEIVGRLTEQLERGERIDLAAYKKEFPEHFEQLEQLLPTLKTMVRLGRTGNDSSNHTGQVEQEPEAEEKRLGDYRIMEEIGRGGMGVVYRAQQISMGRTVALKVLPFAAVMDEKAITRFKNEARAAGTLHHDNIVPVHAVGSERGVYYYAMALIEGLSLAEVIQAQKQQVLSEAPVAERLLPDHVVAEQSDDASQVEPGRLGATVDSGVDARVSPEETYKETSRLVQAAISTRRSLFGSRFFNEVVGIGIQASDALHHAHEHGIVHRDIKPGNLMIDRSGKTWVTDFGLARIESDASMTMTGDVLGTLRYMAPEQALAKRIVVDQRADIYSLGATLYELLTLRPVFDGVSREELFKQLTFEEPKPLSYFQPGVSTDLETIVLKAISKSPDERYATAAELADDLRAFQESRPIKAKPISIWQRSQKWAMRHQTLVVASAIVLLVAVFALTGSTIAISFQQSQTQAALTEVQQQKKRAEEHFSQAREAVDTYLTRVSEDQLLNEPGLQPLRRDLLELALDYYERFVEQRGDDSQLQAEYAEAMDRVVEIRDALGTDQSIVAGLYSRALEIRRRLFEEDPENEELRHSLAQSYLRKKTYSGIKYDEQLDYFGRAVELTRPLTAPKHRLTLAHALADLAGVQVYHFRNVGGVEKMAVAHRHLSEAIDIYEETQDQNVVDGPFLSLPRSYQAMANWHFLMGNSDEAKRYDLEAMDQLERLAEAFPENIKVQRALASSSQDADQKIEVLEALAKNNPFAPGFRLQVAQAHRYKAFSLQHASNAERCVESFTTALRMLEALVESHPQREEFKNELAVSHRHLGSALIAVGKLDEAIENCHSAIEILTETGAFSGQLGDAYWLLSQSHEQAERWDEAIDALRSCIEVRNKSELSDQQLHFQTAGADRHYELAKLLLKTGRIEEAIVEYQRSFSMLEDNLFVDKIDGTPEQIVRARIAYAYNRCEFALDLHELHREIEAASALEQAINSMEPLFDDETTRPFAVMTSSKLLTAVAGRASNPAHVSTLRQLLRENIDSELEKRRRLTETDGWDNWNKIAFRGFGGVNWKGADREARLAVKFAPHDPDHLLGTAPLLLLAGETAEYRQLCHRLLNAPPNASPEEQFRVENWTVRLCGLDREAAGDADRVLALARKSMTLANDKSYWFVCGLGRAYYRAGQYEQAVETLTQALTLKPESAEPLICLDLALASHYWGRGEEASKWYQRAVELLQADGLRYMYRHERAETAVLRHEAEQLFGKGSSRGP